ncbi:MAG: FAD-binding oxidoreductase [Verrucomicrobia bacterium]|nr:FAD-binding oxidoreductase [Verrucomicrobiota bacterium]MBU4247112.1 FAD-binding oxidoreductase [Verrucomicrobiota bacterium]MBU4289998.1 FAD-binding oxidoreductase [Verrucomicrobiota bacterium]MBU4497027.1 FAD-binding oxidoreductase [Verrucomicrobiota bacterium]
MDRILGLRHDAGQDRVYLRCQPGVTLEALDKAIEKKTFPGEEDWPAGDREALAAFRQSGVWMFPPDPTERSATLGGMTACNASGARTLFYGSTRHYVARLRMVLADGSILDLRRGACLAADQGQFQLALPDRMIREGVIPGYVMPPIKNAAGYFSQPGMDLLDLFIGSEGTLGVFTEIEIMLIPAPEMILGVIGFFPSESEALAFVRSARIESVSGEKSSLPSRPLALEYFDAHALDLLREQKQKVGPSSPIPALPSDAGSAVYIELAATENSMEEAAEALLASLEACGSRSDSAWTATSPEETERLKAFRHALPEAVNQRIGERAAANPGLTKLGTDFAVPDEALEKMLATYHQLLEAEKLDYVIFGHIGNNHVHVNILPRDLVEYRRGKALYLELAKQALGWGGTVSAEHGIGKLKKPLLQLMYGDAGIDAMRAVKRVFDPESRLNPGNMFD